MCVQTTSPSNLRIGSWYGSTLAANPQVLYSCGFKDGFDLLDGRNKGRYTGTCFSLSGSSVNPSQHISFVRDNKWNWDKKYDYYPSSRSNWVIKSDYNNRALSNNIIGRYAFSAAVDNQGQLILGGSTNAFDNLGWSFKKYGNLWKSTGNIVKVQNKASIYLPNE